MKKKEYTSFISAKRIDTPQVSFELSSMHWFL
uniref:Uncharacterized protein n=1 Tax=Arundo donax TaxID=35708 RepID=A0A0A9EN39_ARUDO